MSLGVYHEFQAHTWWIEGVLRLYTSHVYDFHTPFIGILQPHDRLIFGDGYDDIQLGLTIANNMILERDSIASL